MAGKVYGSFEELVAAVQKTVPTILKDYVSDVAEEILLEHIESDIYAAYTPKENGWIGGETYHRRHALEAGLDSHMEGNDTLVVTSRADPSPAVLPGYSVYGGSEGGLFRLLESGNMGISGCQFPRPAIANTQNEFESSAAINNAIQRGIEAEIG